MSMLQVCENCDFGCEQQDSKFLKCLLDNHEKGLFEYCDNFKKQDGEHVTK